MNMHEIRSTGCKANDQNEWSLKRVIKSKVKTQCQNINISNKGIARIEIKIITH